MATQTVVKIDVAGSKAYARGKEASDPEVRHTLLRQLNETSRQVFPFADLPYPEGSFYKADGDAAWLILEKSSVAVRCSIAFMQAWFARLEDGLPDCRIMLDRGEVKQVEAPGKTELTGRVFEQISEFEPGLPAAKVFVTDEVLRRCDRTIATFSFYSEVDSPPSKKLRLFTVNYVDPRTVGDSSLAHALFVANPAAEAARERVVELLLLEYLLVHGAISGTRGVRDWLEKKGYPRIPGELVKKVLKASRYVQPDQAERTYKLEGRKRRELEAAQREFEESRTQCAETVSDAIRTTTGTELSLEGVDIPLLVDEYLCGVFSEIRMIANYFRDTSQVFQGTGDTLDRFDYLLSRGLPPVPRSMFSDWKKGFLSGLRTVAASSSSYVAAVFHNILATYYLNRQAGTTAYQEELLKKRKIFLDTNVLYSRLVPTSPFHDVMVYCTEELGRLGIRLAVYPFSLQEYETSLETVQKDCPKNVPRKHLLDRNPWILQEYEKNKARYLGRFALCREAFSVAGDTPVVEENFEALALRLRQHGIGLQTEYREYDEEEVEATWLELRNRMPSDYWDMDKYWDFLYREATKHPEVITHDVLLVKNIDDLNSGVNFDSLGHVAWLITLDFRGLHRLRKTYPFILSPMEFLEFFLPYMFLANVPLEEATAFPNRLLGAGLATLIAAEPPGAVEYIRYYLENPEALADKQELRLFFGQRSSVVLNRERLAEICEVGKELDRAGRDALAREIATAEQRAAEAELRRQVETEEVERLKKELARERARSEKLGKTVHYWRGQARRTDS